MAASPLPGKKWSVNESAQIHTSGALPSRAALFATDLRSVFFANAGIERRWSMPAVALASRATGFSFTIRLASGATGAARSAHQGSRPSRRWLRGRRTPWTSCFWCSASALYVAMSTPVGQSEAQPLQARQRSSASATAGSANPCTSDPSIASWSTRARPRVESFSSRVAR